MKKHSRELLIGIFVSYFLIVCFSPNTSAENLPNSNGDQLNNRAINSTISQLITRSNNIENMRDFSNKRIRDKVLGTAAENFFSQESESSDSEVYLFSDAAAPWFQGWYTRITGTDGSSIAVIGASQYLPDSKTEDYLPGYLAVIVQDIEEQDQIKIYEHFPQKTFFWSNRDEVLDDPASPLWEDFLWCEIEDGQCTDNKITNKSIRATVVDVESHDKIMFDAILGPRLPYSSNIQWLGPEGLVEFLPFIPLHWFVYSLGSDAEYSYEMYDEDGEQQVKVRDATGYAHQESNWGTVFPPAWVWSEGISPFNSHQFALSGGELTLNGTSLTTWMVAYHSPRVQWQFRPTLPNTEYQTTINACEGTFSITARDSIRKLEITATADSFFKVYVPTPQGFIFGAEESFLAKVTIKAFVKLPWLGYILIDNSTFNNVALEFGGNYMQICENE